MPTRKRPELKRGTAVCNLTQVVIERLEDGSLDLKDRLLFFETLEALFCFACGRRHPPNRDCNCWVTDK